MERGTKIFKRMLGVVLAIVMCMTLTTVQTQRRCRQRQD